MDIDHTDAPFPELKQKHNPYNFQAGTLAVFVGLAFTFALTCVAIYQRRNLFRIYQNRTSPEQLLVRAAKGTVRRKWVCVYTSNVSCL